MRSDKSIFLFLKSFFWRKLYLISLLFVHYRVIWQRYFSLLDRLLRLFFYWLYQPIICKQCTFYDKTSSTSTAVFILLSHGASINFFFWTLFPFFFFLLLISSISLSFGPWIFYHIPTRFRFWLFLVFVQMLWMLIPVNKLKHMACNVSHVSWITT